uniref:Terpenoid cyclases/Protein prenyltransferase n=1 Tax=Mycena chlorophos TaxID=658473 RepID=A0ABQ0L868_MYCCL|nr:terpenoid cyclases/Protein prenyltransferase [Mycena chlorophos]
MLPCLSCEAPSSPPRPNHAVCAKPPNISQSARRSPVDANPLRLRIARREPMLQSEDMSASTVPPLPPLARDAHIHHVMQALSQIPAGMVSLDSSRMLIIFYCVSTLDLLGALEEKTTAAQRDVWRTWIWEQYVAGPFGTAFKPGTSMNDSTPHLITTYAALLSLAALRDDFTRLNRPGVLAFLQACQKSDGSFASTPPVTKNTPQYTLADADMRNVYCAFCICSLLGEPAWRGIDVERAVEFIGRCRTYEGGYGQLPGCEAQGGTTYLAIACLRIAPPTQSREPEARLSLQAHAHTEHWLVHNQDAASGGFRGRTGKPPDSCYCFWVGAALQVSLRLTI